MSSAPRAVRNNGRRYKAKVLGEIVQVCGFDDQGQLCLASGARYTFRPLKESAIIPSSRLAAVASLRQSSLGWMVDDLSLNEWEQSLRGKEHARHSPKDHRLLDLFLFLNDRDTEPTTEDSVRIEAVAWFEGREFADGSGEPLLLVSFRAVAPSRSSAKGQGKCGVCGWIHDDGFTAISIPGKPPMTLTGVLPDIVACVHKSHVRGLEHVSTSDESLLRVCGTYVHPAKAFNTLKRTSEYKLLFATRRGFIALRRFTVKN